MKCKKCGRDLPEVPVETDDGIVSFPVQHNC
jgi:hypothetical protein